MYIVHMWKNTDIEYNTMINLQAQSMSSMYVQYTTDTNGITSTDIHILTPQSDNIPHGY